MASWPTTLPNPNAPNYGLNPVDQTARSEMDAGTSRVRRRTQARNDHVACTWEMNDTQLAAFRTWFDDGSAGAAGGAAWFTVTLAIGTGGLVACTARFTKIYQVSHLGGLIWNVTGELEVQ